MRKYWRKLEQILAFGNNWKKWRSVVTVMAMAVVFVTTYALILPAITLEKDQGKPEQGVYLDNVERGSTASLDGDEAETLESGNGQHGSSAAKAGRNNENISGSEDADGLENADNQKGETASDHQDDVSENAAKDSNEDLNETTFSRNNQMGSSQKTADVQSGTDQGTSQTYAGGVYTGKGDGYTVSLELTEDMRLPADVKVSVEEIREENEAVDILSEYRSYMAAAKRTAVREGRGEISSVRFLKVALLSGDKEVRTSEDIDMLIVPDQKDRVRNGEEAHVFSFRGSAAYMIEDLQTKMIGYRVSAYRFLYPSIKGNSNWGLLALVVTEPEKEDTENEMSEGQTADEGDPSTINGEGTENGEQASTEGSAAATEESSTEEIAAENGTDVTASTETDASTEKAASTESTASTEETAATDATTETEPASTETADEEKKPAGKLEYDGEGYKVVMTYDEKAAIPEGAELKVREILPNEEEYQQYYNQSLKAAGVVVKKDSNTSETENESKAKSKTINESGVETKQEDKVSETSVDSYARIFDIEIWAGDHKIQPKSNVTVDIRLMDAPKKPELLPHVVHFAENEAEVMELTDESNINDNDIQFETNGFSVYSIVYTADLQYDAETGTLSYEDNKLKVTVSAKEKDVFPDGAVLIVKEMIPEDADAADTYAQAITALSNSLRKQNHSFSAVKVYDISILDKAEMK